jgi:hypothetical protein
MRDCIKLIYNAFGFDLSGPLRKLTRINDDEAIMIGKIFKDEISPWKVERQGEGEFERIILWQNNNYEDTITLSLNGEIRGPAHTKRREYELVSQYLFSIGVEHPILTDEKLKKLGLEKKSLNDKLKQPSNGIRPHFSRLDVIESDLEDMD